MAQSGNLATIPDVNDILELKLYCKFDSQIAVNVRHFGCIDKQGTGASFSTIMTYYSGILAPLMKALLTSQATYSGLSIQKLAPPPASAAGFDNAGTGPGEVVGDPLPKQVCGVITLRSSLAGRANRGRIYVPFPCEEDNDDDSSPIANYLVRMDELADALTGVDEIGGVGNTIQLESVVLHRASMSATALRTWRINDKWGTQRRRGDYGQSNISPI